MKKIFFILLVTCLFSMPRGYSQDSARTRNDKPGTPQSLRTTNTAPQTQLHVVNPNVAPNQSINHGATESNGVNNKQEQIITTAPNTGKEIPNNSISTGRADSTNSSIINNRKTNVTNPIRK